MLPLWGPAYGEPAQGSSAPWSRSGCYPQCSLESQSHHDHVGKLIIDMSPTCCAQGDHQQHQDDLHQHLHHRPPVPQGYSLPRYFAPSSPVTTVLLPTWSWYQWWGWCWWCLWWLATGEDGDCGDDDDNDVDVDGGDGDDYLDLRVVLARSRVDWDALVMLHTAYIGFIIWGPGGNFLFDIHLGSWWDSSDFLAPCSTQQI